MTRPLYPASNATRPASGSYSPGGMARDTMSTREVPSNGNRRGLAGRLAMTEPADDNGCLYIVLIAFAIYLLAVFLVVILID